MLGCSTLTKNKDESILGVVIISSSINQNSDNQISFQYWLHNYRDSLTKDIKVRCDLIDLDGNLLVRIDDNFGNIHSSSNDIREVFVDDLNLKLSEEHDGYCYIQSCGNCDTT